MLVTAELDSLAFGETEFTDVRDEAETFSQELTEEDAGRTRKVLITQR